MRLEVIGLVVGLGIYPVTALLAQEGTAGVPGAAALAPTRTAEQWHEEGVRLLRERQTEAATERFRQAVALDEQSALFVTDLGYAYLKQRRLLDAETAFKKGIELDPARPHAYEHLEQSITQQPQRWEKRQELLRILDQGLASAKDRDPRIRLELARIRAERSFGLVERAHAHVEDLLRQDRIPRALEKQAQDLRAAIEQDKQARMLRDWPEPKIEQADQERLLDCERITDPVRRRASLDILAALLSKEPAWRAPRRLRAKILTEEGHYDEAVKELTILTRLAPSEPDYHRQLGILLAEHGGLLELERADEALRIALALEPEWSELEPIRQRLAARRYDSRASRPKAKDTAAGPTENAIRLYSEAEASLDQDPTNHAVASALIEQALRESPTYVEAAALSYSLSGQVPEATVRSLWNDAAGMLTLYQEFSHTDPPAPRAILDSWLNRAIELGNVEGRLSRALNKKRHGDIAAAELELSQYLALVADKEEVQAVQALRAELMDKRQPPDQDAILNARWRLQRDDPQGALRVLDAPCRVGMVPEQLLALGIAYERLGANKAALDCYEVKLGNATTHESNAPFERRMARLLARSAPNLFEHPAAARLPELSRHEPAALWALARRTLDKGNADAAAGYVSRYLARADPEDRFVVEATALLQRLQQRHQLQQEGTRRQRQIRLVAAGVCLGVFAVLTYWLLFRGSSVARAVRRKPQLFPDLARVIGGIRHDVLKHRTSALELLRHDQTNLEKLRSTMLEPIPTSTVVADAYARLVSAARAEGITLRRLHREPVFGSLTRDLIRVERSMIGNGNKATILAADERLRGIHKERLDRLIALGPRCHLDAAEIQRWIAAIEAELTGKQQPFTMPALQMSDLSLWFPIDKAALFQIFSNLLRNAECAVSQCAAPRLQVSLVSAIDFTGKPLVRLQVADNAITELREEVIESQRPDRGLGIVRDTVRDWNGHWVITEEAAPYRKSVGVQFSQ